MRRGAEDNGDWQSLDDIHVHMQDLKKIESSIFVFFRFFLNLFHLLFHN